MNKDPAILRDIVERLRRNSYYRFDHEHATCTLSGDVYELEREEVLRAIDAGIFQHDGFMTAQLRGRLDGNTLLTSSGEPFVETYQSARGPQKTFIRLTPAR